jgi:hypothetical protein
MARFVDWSKISLHFTFLASLVSALLVLLSAGGDDTVDEILVLVIGKVLLAHAAS